jgi:hypothetical protein
METRDIRGEVVETSSKVPAYNGEIRPARGRAKDNTVGSLTETQRSVIVGTLLGDGAMRCKTNALLEINHSYAQREYVDWKYQVLANLVATPQSCATVMLVDWHIGLRPEVCPS